MERLQIFVRLFRQRVYRVPKVAELTLTFVGVFLLTVLARLGSDLALPPRNVVKLDQSRAGSRGGPVEGTLIAENGKALELSDFRKKVTILSFWSPNCGACQGEMERLNQLKTQMAAYGLEVLFVEARTQETFWGAVQKQRPRPSGVASDPDHRMAKILGVSSLPATLVLDREGRKTMVLSGPQNWNHPKFKAVVEDLLAE